MPEITSTMTVGEAQVRAIFENPGLSNTEVLAVVKRTHPNSATVKTVAWYRARAKRVVESDIGALSKSLVAVCREYRREVPAAAFGQTTVATVRRPPAPVTGDGASEWPAWNLPGDDEVLKLAAITIPYIRFLHPDIISAIVEDNERHRTEWTARLAKRGIDPSLYLWDRSPCAFPGVRRYAGSSEIAQYRKRMEATAIPGAVELDDNSYPKAIWSFVFRGRRFQNEGPAGYALAHLADHKTYGNRSAVELEEINAGWSSKAVFGLYTSVSNTVYAPTSLIRPTDFGFLLRNLLQRKAVSLYGEFCNLLPPPFAFRGSDRAAWSLDAFQWAEPVGNTDRIAAFLAYRNDRVERLLGTIVEKHARLMGNEPSDSRAAPRDSRGARGPRR